MSTVRRSSRLAASTNADPVAPPATTSTLKKPKPAAAPAAPKVAELEVGDKIPAISLSDQNDNQVNLADVAQSHPYVVIFAYPKASTPGCTRQLCGFEANYPFFSDHKVAVFGLSADLPKAQGTFATKQKALFQLLSDPDHSLIKPLGATKSPKGIKRSHWIFKNGVLKVKSVQVSPEISVNSARESIQKFIDEDATKNGSD